MEPTSILIAGRLKALLQTEKTFLVRAGFHVHAAEDGARAVEVARAAVPRLILIDLEMPGMDGAAACAAMRREAALATAPIVIMGATDNPRDRDRCLQAGATEFVTKPRTPEDLLAVVARLLSVKERRAIRVRVVFLVTGELDRHRMVGKAANLSATGLLLLNEETLPLGSVLDLQFTVPKINRPIAVKGKVVRVGWREDGLCEAGIHFLDLNPEDQQEILNFTSL